ncbi:MAG TPA: nickel pincer cofactor biosynthesis protein LarB [Verrucomicrobiae bacterium]|jgi:NCAIR mutase (PurE)-related protein|nr:nickel pincer cofactor biosynthesis protein LarB [Verrucomicrobiae bacterium]
MDTERLLELLEGVRRGKLSVAKALDRLRHMPFEDLGFAKVDHHRPLRQGFPEVILGEGKTAGQIASIARALRRRRANVLITRLAPEKMTALKRMLKGLRCHEQARAASWLDRPIRIVGRGTVLVVCAGTSDIPVAEEAAVTAETMANRVERLYDVGVAGLHRLLENRDKLFSAAVLIVVAGMEGALPSVVAGLVDKPVIAVPTSVGYGASFHGLAALLGMLNSCAGGVTVVNIDNGFGAGFAASLINRV